MQNISSKIYLKYQRYSLCRLDFYHGDGENWIERNQPSGSETERKEKRLWKQRVTLQKQTGWREGEVRPRPDEKLQAETA